MATYEINFSALNTAKGNLENTLNELQQQMKKLDEIQETMLSDSSWKGPNKTRFRKSFNEYQTALDQLYKSAVDHYEKLVQMMNEYAKAEMN